MKSAFFVIGLSSLALIVSGCAFTPEAVLNEIPQSVCASYTRININDQKSHYPQGELAHFHISIKEICLSSDTWSNYPQILWHETAHAYYEYLNETGSDFKEKWKEIGGGALTQLGWDQDSEDIAYCVMLVHLEAWGIQTELQDIALHRLTHSQEGPSRKLRLLRDYGFYTNETYQFCLGNFKKSYWNRARLRN